MPQNYSIIPLSDSKQWNNAIANVPHSFTHTAEHCKSVQINTGLRTFLFLFEKDGVKIFCPLIERELDGFKDIAKPFGISGFAGNGDHIDFYGAWMEFIKNGDYVTGYTAAHPVFGKHSWFPDDTIYHQSTIQILDIQPDLEKILSNMSQKRRQQLNKWDAFQKHLVTDRERIKAFFLHHYHSFLDRKKARSYYYFSSEALKSFFSAKNSIVVGAEEDGEVISATYFGYTDYFADALFNLSLPRKNYYSAELIWNAVLELKKLGVSSLNLGGGDNSIAEFKRRFGAYDVPMFSIKEVYDEIEYSHLTNQSLENVNNHEGFFPAYRKK